MTPRGAPFGPEGFRAATNVSRETLERLNTYAGLLETWSRKINLVGRATLPELWRRHMLDSAQLMELLPPPPADRARELVDLGSGAGFPGLVLSILGAGRVHLVETNGKKAAFLLEAARVTGADAVVHCCRIEDLPPMAADVVTARALAPLTDLLALAEPLLCAGTSGRETELPNSSANEKANNDRNCSHENRPIGLFPKGRGAERELTDSQETWKMTIEVIPSRSDPQGRIIRVSGLARKGPRQ